MNGAPERHRVLKSKLILRRINFSVYYVLFYLSDDQIYPPRDNFQFFRLLFRKNIVAGINQMARDANHNGFTVTAQHLRSGWAGFRQSGRLWIWKQAAWVRALQELSPGTLQALRQVFPCEAVAELLEMPRFKLYTSLPTSCRGAFSRSLLGPGRFSKKSPFQRGQPGTVPVRRFMW
jgi:hypothetical protein